MANSVDPDEMAHYEPSHLDLHCLQSLFWIAGMSLTLKALSRTIEGGIIIFFSK